MKTEKEIEETIDIMKKMIVKNLLTNKESEEYQNKILALEWVLE